MIINSIVVVLIREEPEDATSLGGVQGFQGNSSAPRIVLVLPGVVLTSSAYYYLILLAIQHDPFTVFSRRKAPYPDSVPMLLLSSVVDLGISKRNTEEYLLFLTFSVRLLICSLFCFVLPSVLCKYY